jgi:hypothetical protein
MPHIDHITRMEDFNELRSDTNLQYTNSADEESINDNVPAIAKRSKPSTPLQAINQLFEISFRLGDVVSELKYITKILSKESDLKEIILSLQKQSLLL